MSNSSQHRVTTSVTDVEFGAPGERIRGRLHLPDGNDEVPGVVLGHGWAMCADGDLQDYAAAIAQRGLAALTFDYRRLGRSEGTPRQELNPYDQIDDFKTALTWLADHPRVRPTDLGVWGSSYGGGHVLVVAATDPRVSAVVAQVPTISGSRAGLRKMPAAAAAELYERFNADRLSRARGAAPAMVQTVGEPGTAGVTYPDAESYAYMSEHGARVQVWRNETTLRSLEYSRSYDPGRWVDQIGPAALLMIVADADTTTPTDLQLDAYTSAREPKHLEIVSGGHYSVYREHFAETSTLAADWFAQHLRNR
ncbi:MAG: alpha/beta fold hydrolase [Bowdeniella nasicola]|nr:alpha/beta fold hydrolase [Bowdeniella nasicola]